MKFKWWWLAIAALAVPTLYLLAWPVPIDPVPYLPDAMPAMVGPYAPNEALREAQVLADGRIHGPETIAVAPDGTMFGGTHDGKIIRVSADGATASTFADTGGRPLGLAWDAQGKLIVADAKKGLLAVSPEGAIELLTASHGDRPFGFTDDVDVAGDGRIFFSDASDKFGYGHHIEDLLEARPHGRLLSYDPATQKTELVLDELYFANGVALAADDSFVLVNETNRFRVLRVWLKGPQAGQRDVFCNNLPGYPDGISRSPRGTFWVAMFTMRTDLDWLSNSAFLKKVVFRLPSALMPIPPPYGMAVELDADGNVLRSLHDPTGGVVSEVTSVEEVNGALYFGTLLAPRITRLQL